MEEFSDKEKKIIGLLSEAGLNRNTAKVLVFLSKKGEAVARDIERAANLRQPEVSLIMKELKNWGWIKEREIKRQGKGRPLKNYKLAVDLKDRVAELVDQKRKKIKQVEKDLEELKRYIS